MIVADVNPKAIVILGRRDFDPKYTTDFEVIRRKYANIADILTYDDLLDYFRNIIRGLEEVKTMKRVHDDSGRAAHGGVRTSKTDLTAIILIGQEKIHLKRCIERLAPLEPKCIWLIESQPDDGGVAIAKEAAAKCGLTVKTVFNKWPGLYAKQFNWALDYVEREVKVKGEGEQRTDWILRLDADEYLTPDTIEKLKTFLCTSTPNSYTSENEVVGLTLELKRRFCGREIRHATNGIRLLRIWRAGHGRSEERAMDEHIEVDGKVIDFDGAFYDDNLNDMEWWRNKHRGYAKREAADALAFARGEIHFKPAKEAYYKMPCYLRALIYFSIRYFLKGGFLDGYAGWMWNFWQGLWYRWIVDREIGRLRRERRE